MAQLRDIGRVCMLTGADVGSRIYNIKPPDLGGGAEERCPHSHRQGLSSFSAPDSLELHIHRLHKFPASVKQTRLGQERREGRAEADPDDWARDSQLGKSTDMRRGDSAGPKKNPESRIR